MKRVIVCILILALCLSFAACAKETPSASPNETEQVTTSPSDATETPDATEDPNVTEDPNMTENPDATEKPENSDDPDNPSTAPEETQNPTDNPGEESTYKNPAPNADAVLLKLMENHPKQEDKENFANVNGDTSKLQIEYVYIHTTMTAYNKYHLTMAYAADATISVIAQALADLFESATGYDDISVTVDSIYAYNYDEANEIMYEAEIDITDDGQYGAKTFLANGKEISEEEYPKNNWDIFEFYTGAGNGEVGFDSSLGITITTSSGSSISTVLGTDADWNNHVQVVLHKDLSFVLPYKDNGTNHS